MTRSAHHASAMMAAVGLASLAVTGQIGSAWLLAGACAIMVHIVTTWTRIRIKVPSAVVNGFIIAAMGVSVADYLWFSPTLLHVGAHLLIALLIARLGHATAREFRQLVVIVFFLMVAAAGLSPQGTFNVGFVPYLLVMVWVLIQYHLQAEAERAGTGPEAPAVGLGLWTAVAAFLALVTAGALFLLLPRMGLELLSGTQPNDLQLSGFSPQVRLGVMGPVKRDPTIVMRVSGAGLGPGSEPLYLRGAVFDTFDGTNWTSSAPSRRQVPSDGEGRFTVSATQRAAESFSIQAEPLDTTVVFAPDRTGVVLGPFPALLMDEDGVLNAPYPPGVRQRYDVIRREHGVHPARSLLASPRFLRVTDADRIGSLAEEISRDAPTPTAKVSAIQRFLRTRYTYTLDVPGGEDRPIDAFLFERRSGYCEHFASAMVVMLRTVGISARLVTGFLAQEWNPYGTYVVVRQADAHAWVEAFVPDVGWMRFDPTPPAPPTDRPWTSDAQHYWDALRTGWNRYVADFGLRDQHAAIERAEAAWASLRDRSARGWSTALTTLGSISDRVWIAGAAISALLFLVGWATSLWRTRSGGGSSATDASVAFYLRLLRILERKGLSKPEGVTPAEFAEHQAADQRIADAIRRVTARYYEVRYGRRPLSDSDRQRIESDLATIEQG